MNRRRGASLVSLFVILVCSAQVSNATNFNQSAKSNLKVALTAYSKMMLSLESQETALTNGYGAVTGSNYRSDAITLSAFLKLAPKFNSFISKIESITPTDSRILSAHNLYIEGWNLQDEALLLDISAIQNNDYAAMSQANAKLAKGRADIRAFRAAFEKLLSQVQ